MTIKNWLNKKNIVGTFTRKKTCAVDEIIGLTADGIDNSQLKKNLCPIVL